MRRLDGELRACPKRDVAGLVLFTLRGEFATAPQFNAAAQRVATGIWWPVADGYVWQPAARAVDSELLHVTEATAPGHASLWGAAC